MGASRAQIMIEERDLEIVLGSPDPRLRDCVRRYFGYFERSSGFSHTRELPSADVTLIIGFGPPIGIAYPRSNGGTSTRHTSFVAGLHDATSSSTRRCAKAARTHSEPHVAKNRASLAP